MRTVSDAYLVAINADSEQTTFWSEFGFVPPGAREGLALSQSGFGRWGDRLSQLNNRVYGMGAKWASLELNRPILGQGWRYYDPDSAEQIGEWSQRQSGPDGVFPEPPKLTMTLDAAYDLIGIQIIFDDLGGEWATEVDVSYFDETDVLMEARTFYPHTPNGPIDWQMNGVKRVDVFVKRWSLPGRFAKVCQVIPGQIRHFTDENTYSFFLTESISPFETLTVPECTITFDNENQEYNIINPAGVTAKLRELMEIPSSIGLVTAAGIERVSTGDFFLFSWPDSANDETAAFNCRPDLAFANGNYDSLSGNRTVSEIADHISDLATLRVPIAVDPSLADINVNGRIGAWDDTPLQDAVAQLAIAAGGYLKFERDGSYTIKPLLPGATVRGIGYDAMWTKPEIKQSPLLSGVNVTWLDLNARENKTEFLSGGKTLGEVKEVSSGFISSQSEAQRVGAIALDYYSHRLQYNFDYRGDMSIEAGDVVAVETDYGFRNVLILEHEISYDSANFLQGRIRGVEV